MSENRPCEYVPPSVNSRWAIEGRAMCTAFAEPHSKYCPAHRGGIERTGGQTPCVKHDLNLDVLPWSAEDTAALGKNDRKRTVKQER